tara:strand:- start:847 stop:1350 length:504 start_codon:yes stop_codon:yes gene_type:complete
MLEALITSKTRLRMLIKFFISASNEGYLNGLATEFNESTNSIRKELNNLSESGYLIKQKKDNKIIYQANNIHPMFKVLQKIVRQHLGIEDIVDVIISRIGDVDKIVLVGDYAKGLDTGRISIIIIGKEFDDKYLKNLKLKIRDKIEREVVFQLNSEIPRKNIILFQK